MTAKAPISAPDSDKLLADTAQTFGNVTGLKMIGQEQSNWCWAAVVQTILVFRQKGNPTQEQIVTAHLQRTGRTYSCAPPNSGREEGGHCKEGSCTASCNDEHSIKVALEEYGLLEDLLSKKKAPTFEQIQAEVAANRPVPSHVAWTSPGGHIILVSGWSVTPQGKKMIHVMDPKSIPPGSLVSAKAMSYSAYAKSYKQDGKIGAVDYSYKVK